MGAFEKSCDGKEVVFDTQTVTANLKTVQSVKLQLQAMDADKDGYVDVVSGGTDCKDDNTKINPGAEELCNDTDDNCDGVSDDTHFKLNQTCEVSVDCRGISRCHPVTQTQYCDTPPIHTVYPDADGDTYGLKDSQARIVCGEIPTSYTSGPPTDCRDDVFSINPGTQDLCDDEDTNCDGSIDEAFPAKGQTCTNATTQCEGTRLCSADKRSLECVSPAPPKWYLDEDGDGYGAGAFVESCVKPAGSYIRQGGDCDDGNLYTHPSASEICDDLDNNCDSQKETAAQCPSQTSPSWVLRFAEGETNWLTASSWGKGSLWIAGNNNRRARMTFPETYFTVISSTDCGSSAISNDTVWTSVWSDPTDGRAWLGSEGGLKGYLHQGSTRCVIVIDDNLKVFGLAGVRANNILSLYGASEHSAVGEGAAFMWNGIGAPAYNHPTNHLSEVFDVHANTHEHVLAVGGVSFNPRARIYRFEPTSGLWNPESVPGADRLRGVWVVNDKVAFAVGDSGNVVRKTHGTQWVSVASTPDNHNLTSVIAFGANSAYATCASGHIYRFDGQTWTRVYNGSGRLNDITGTGPDDLWVVGNGGQIIAWPGWPRSTP
ncbi:putative metal-binding motif-containing protein [Myxococcus landrumensis]|uniref:putative metal-binding motif-containing protein n=1 Tax=Myxococcus landrumensis TaxID=2813577 RepID=UPI001F5118B7|nr:putative metal-binding motif-containing protein [Myxococcus landrumus]